MANRTIVSLYYAKKACGTVFAHLRIFANRLLSSLKHTTLHKLILLATSNGLILGAETQRT